MPVSLFGTMGQDVNCSVWFRQHLKPKYRFGPGAGASSSSSDGKSSCLASGGGLHVYVWACVFAEYLGPS